MLDAVLRPDTAMGAVLKLAFVAFESTRLASGDVGYPLDVLTFGPDRRWRQREFAEEELWVLRRWWEVSLSRLIDTLPEALQLTDLLPVPAEPGSRLLAAKPAITQMAANDGSASPSG